MGLLRRSRERLPKARGPEEVRTRIKAALDWFEAQSPESRLLMEERAKGRARSLLQSAVFRSQAPDDWDELAEEIANRREEKAARKRDLTSCAEDLMFAQQLRAEAPKAARAAKAQARDDFNARNPKVQSMMPSSVGELLGSTAAWSEKRCSVCGIDLSLLPAMVDHKTGRAYCDKHAHLWQDDR